MRRSMSLLVTLPFAAGCMTSRDEVRITVPDVSAPVSQSGHVIVFRAVTDHRVFQDHRPDPSIPSLGWGGPVADVPPDIKARAVARKRAGIGKALGDILLPADQTVAGVVRDLMAAGLAGCGCTVRPQGEWAREGDVVIDVDIEKFWSWLTPGWDVTNLHGHAVCEVRMARGSATRTVKLEAERLLTVHGQAYGPSWEKAIAGIAEELTAAARRSLCGQVP